MVNSFDALSVLTICAGTEPDVKDFFAHEWFLTARSEIFRRAMNGNWSESESRVVNLPEDSSHIFTLYINYV
jgi:hypothetical protein